MILVPATGNPESKIALVGEAPGENEILQGKPFVGMSGELLTQLLHNAGIPRASCYITNVIKERPPSNNIKRFIDLEKSKVTPEYIAYETELLKELSECSANVIVPLGAVALYALTRQSKILNWRGSVLESVTLPGRKVIPTIHPAGALRQHIWKHLILSDLNKAAKELDFPEIRRPSYELILNPTSDQAMEFIRECERAPRVGFDIEVSNHQLDCFSLALSPTLAISIPFMANGIPNYAPDTELWITRRLAKLLENDFVTKVIQNSSFDVSFMYNRYGIVTRGIDDTMIAEGLIYPDFPKSLAFQCSIYTDFPYYKDEGKFRHKGFAGDDMNFWRYNALDSLVLMHIMPKLVENLKKLEMLHIYSETVKLVQILSMFSSNGIDMDKDAMEEHRKRLLDVVDGKETGEIQDLREELNRIAGMSINANSPKQVAALVYGVRGYKPLVKNGSVTTDDDAMRRLAKNGCKEAELIIKIRGLRKLYGTYLTVPLEDGKLKSSYNPVGAITGRLSSSRTIFDTGTNMQNQPRVMKQYMKVPPGMVGYNIDLAGAESRIVAYVGPVPALIEAYEKGVDVHALTASRLLSKPVTEISREPGSFGIGDYSERDIGKRWNHSGNYGVGYKTLSQKFGIPESLTKKLLMNYHANYPEIQHGFQAQVREMVLKLRTITNCFGRKYRIMDRVSPDRIEETYYAWIPQSTVGDIVNQRGLNYVYYNQKDFGPIQLVNQVHDSIEFFIPLSVNWEEHAIMIEAIRSSMEQPIKWKRTEFMIPVELEMLYPNFGSKKKIPFPLSYESLAAAFEDLQSNSLH